MQFNPSEFFSDVMSDISDHALQNPVFARYEAEKHERNPVIRVFENIKESVNSFQAKLNDEYEVGMQLASFNQSMLLYVTHIDYSEPTLMNFYGFVDGNKAHLVQHVNQLNFLLVAVPKLERNKPARRIGF